MVIYIFGGQKREEINFNNITHTVTTILYVISDGKFGAYMQVNIQNDGPVTIELESSKEKTTGNSERDLC